MKKINKKSELLNLPYIGKASVWALNDIGITTLSQFKKITPEKMYEKCCKAQNTNINKAFLYVLRGAHYYIHHPEIPKKEIKWWLFRGYLDND